MDAIDERSTQGKPAEARAGREADDLPPLAARFAPGSPSIMAAMGGIRCGIVAVIAICLGTHPVRAEVPSEGSLSTYVSDEFKTVAKKLVEQYLERELETACPDKSLVCGVVVERLVDALGAAVEGDTARLHADLDTFFVESALAGTVALALDELVSSAPGGSDVASRLRPVLRPFAGCVVTILEDSRKGCRLDAKIKDVLATAGIQLGADAGALTRLLAAVTAGKSPEAHDVLLTLAGIASAVERDDLRIFLVALDQAVGRGLEGGLFVFTIHYLDSSVAVAAQQRTQLDSAILHANEQPQMATAFTACGASEVWKAWAAHADTVRTAALDAMALGRPLPADATKQLAALLAARCRTLDDAANKSFAQAQRFARFVEGTLSFYEWRTKYGLILPAVALILDLVRTGDQQQLERHTRDLVARAVNQVGWRMCELGLDTTTCVAAANQGATVCQTDIVAALVRGDDPRGPHAKSCIDLPSGRRCTTLLGTPTAAEAAPTDCSFPELAFGVATTDSAVARRAITDFVARYFRDTLRQTFADHTAVYDAIQRALEALGNGDLVTTRKITARLAIEALLDGVDARVKADLGEHACGSVRSVSIFSRIDAACALAVLIESAYYPIADFIWAGGIDEKNAQQVATSAYEGILKSKYLGGSPLILDLGLGATLVGGLASDSVWGTKTSAALTIVDKFGIALYKYNGDQRSFQVGPFVGGFLDALVRAVDNGDNRKFWLAGVTVGAPRLFGDFGLEAHAAFAMPFSFDAFGRQVGWATGGVLVIPWDFWKENK